MDAPPELMVVETQEEQHHIDHTADHPIDQPVDHPIDHTMNHPVDQPMNHPIEPSIEPTMDVVDESMNTTITAPAVAPLPDPPQFHNNGYTSNTENRPQTSYSDTGFNNSYAPYPHSDAQPSRFNSPSDADTPPRQNYYNGSGKEPQIGQPYSRPNSNLGHRYPTSEGGARSVTYQEQNQRSSQPPQEAAAKNTSVVIKVGMVGDAQIGKTSLMVKYVEGSWDEDYIQTLGTSNC